MKKKVLKIISLVLSLLVLFMLVPAVSVFASAKGEAAFEVGDIIEYGSYPQTDVTEALGAVLDAANGEWKSYGYYYGTGNMFDGEMHPSDFMRYKDVVYNGEKYRGVTFDTLRIYYTGGLSYSERSYQIENGYYEGNTYWFKVEPIKWRVLDPDAGLVMCDSIIDSQAYNNYILYSNGEYWGDASETYYASNYAESSVRKWLNEDFYNTAFTEEQKANIKTTAINNDSWFTLNGISIGNYAKYDAPSTDDKVFLLSWDDVKNAAYGFDPDAENLDRARQLRGSDYAKCQGLQVCGEAESEYNGNSGWRLRSAFIGFSAVSVECGGQVKESDQGVSLISCGICPAMKLQELDTDAVKPEIDIHNYTPSKTVDYKTTITFAVDPVQNPVDGGEIHWFINDKDVGKGNTYTVTKAKESFTVQAKYIKDGKVLAESGVESVNVKTGFFAKLAAFFRSIFGALPKVVQGYLGAETVEKILP